MPLVRLRPGCGSQWLRTSLLLVCVISTLADPIESSPVISQTAGLWDWVLHLDVYLDRLVLLHGRSVYGILFAIVFAETGLVICPFLPGDSLLFSTAALAAAGRLSIAALALVFVAAAVLGDGVNYLVGRFLAERVQQSRLVRREHIAMTEQFFSRHGGKAGMGRMPQGSFALFNVVGALAWVGACCGGGYLFGNVPFVKAHFSLVILAILVLSVAPLLYQAWIRVVGTKELEAAVQARTKPLVVDFFASWCGPCVLQSKELIKVAEELGNGVDIIKIDCDRHPDLSRQLQIKGLPTIIIVPSDSSKPAFRTEGLLPAHKIISIIGAETRRAPLNRKAPARHAHKGVVA
ncbi:hypothetical protein QBZ16_002523 [Prototheca wickerhamii]|uniref:Thioredoxin domain-containing protein n=1 Tax=Prototheca wickerhamii TaxID=3111 RepID=A0AAD9IPF7_PROWI|nr:hypothetical protein QBZ16_002523 [Prototheca wickerhamii]